MATGYRHNQVGTRKDSEGSSNRAQSRAHIQRVLTQIGLNPSDYILSPLSSAENTPSQEKSSSHTSAFSSYPSQSTINEQSPVKPASYSLLTSGRPLSYAQQPPPPPPAPPLQAFQSNQGQSTSQATNNQQSSSAPSGPSLFAALFNPSTRNTQNPPPENTQNPPPTNTQYPPPTNTQYPPPTNTQYPPPANTQNTPPTNTQNTPPTNTQNTPSLNPGNPFAPNTQTSTSQLPQDMSSHLFSPRRTPPPLPADMECYPRDSHLSAEHYLREINACEVPPVKIVKQSKQNVVYKKEIRIRYLQPPTPPPPAPIIIRERRIPPLPPASPLLIRERKPEARTPPPLTVRERPPTPPPPLEPYVIEKKIPPPPPQPRQIIVERLPTPPPKPRTVIFEKWLPYKKVKRPVLLQKAPPPEPIKPVRNVIIEYEPLKAYTVRRVIEEGVFRVDPHHYSVENAHSRSECGDVRVVERIEDLPPPSDQLMRVISDYNHSSTHSYSYDHSSPHHVSEHVSPSIQNLLSGAHASSNVDHLTNISRASSTPAYRPERVLSTGYGSSVPSPTVVPLQRSDSKVSPRHLESYTPNDNSMRSRVDDIY